MAIIPNGQRIISASDDCTLKVWDIAMGQMERTLKDHSAGVNAVTITPNGQRAISASNDCTLKVWHLTTGQLERTLEGHADGVNAVAITPDGQRVISASSDRTLKVWDMESGQELATVALDAAIWCVAVTYDNESGKLLVVAGDQAGNVYCLAYVEPESAR